LLDGASSKSGRSGRIKSSSRPRIYVRDGDGQHANMADGDRFTLRQAREQPQTSFKEIAAKIREMTAGRRHTPSEISQREGRDER